jgi:hypothetical protein
MHRNRKGMYRYIRPSSLTVLFPREESLLSSVMGFVRWIFRTSLLPNKELHVYLSMLVVSPNQFYYRGMFPGNCFVRNVIAIVRCMHPNALLQRKATPVTICHETWWPLLGAHPRPLYFRGKSFWCRFDRWLVRPRTGQTKVAERKFSVLRNQTVSSVQTNTNWTIQSPQSINNFS